MTGRIWSITRKEFSTYFSSPVAFIFLGTFSAVCLFIFFWVEQFFARNIVDARPLFEWMPILLIFLSAALTMKMWSEERRMETLEFLFTMPVKTLHLVLGKFLACLGLVAIALVLTVGIPLTVSFMGRLDWGPVLGAYTASLLLAAAYCAIGLYISSRNESQIASLILTTVVCFLFYLVGAQTLSGLVGNQWAEYLGLVATGVRFESITRGILDLRDVYYYVSIVGVFLALNVFSLERLRWAREGQKTRHHAWRAVTALVILNFILANFWLYRGVTARADLTEGRDYSISQATRDLIGQLREPLLVRGYFSARTHPRLAPLVPRIRDTIREIESISGGRVRAEFVDPREEPELEEEANQRYGIRPIPFRTEDRYQTSLVNSYFDILLQYGDKHEVLRFTDLIEIKGGRTGTDIRLRNLEYDLARGIKKVLYGFQDIGALFAGIDEPVAFQGFISAEEKLPKAVAPFKSQLVASLKELRGESGGKFTYEIVDPEAGGGAVAKQLAERYGFRPMAAGPFDPKRFYFYMVLKNNRTTVQVPMPGKLNQESARRSVEAALRRFAPGFIKTIGFHSPPPPPRQAMRRPQPPPRQFRFLQQKLRENYRVADVDLKSGLVPENVDLLLLAAPTGLTPKQRFAMDQFLMKGGSVALLTSPYTVSRTQAGLAAARHTSGLEPLLEHYGATVQKTLVLDPQNEPFPVFVNRRAGTFTVRELKLVPYPYFVDVRGRGLNEDNPITARLPQLTMSWASPLSLPEDKGGATRTTPLLASSGASWVSSSLKVHPDFKVDPKLGFEKEGQPKGRVLAAVVEGTFRSYYAGKESPLVAKDDSEEKPAPPEGGEAAEKTEEEPEPVVTGMIDKSPESARIILIGSNEAFTDQTLQLSRAAANDRFVNSLEFLENVVDWALEDRALLSIRSRAHFARTLVPMTREQKAFWEYLNYGIVLLGLVLIYGGHRYHLRRLRDRYERMLAA